MDRARGAPRWRLGLGVSVLFHTAAASAVLLGLSFQPASAPRPAEALMTVEIAPTPSAPSAPVSHAAIGPQRVEALSRPAPEHPKTPPPPKAVEPVKAEVMMPSQAAQDPQRPILKVAADQTTAPQALAAPSRPEAAAPFLGAANAISKGAQTWESGLLAKLERAKRYPGAAQQRGQEDVVYLRIAIDRAGRLVNANVARSRGYQLLDQEVLDMARRAAPFAAPPATESDPIVLVVPIEFFITQRHSG